MTLERLSAFITYCIAVLLAWLGDLSLKDASTVGGVLIGVLMLAINWYYKHKTYQLLRGPQHHVLLHSPFRLGELPNVRNGIAMVTTSPEAVRLHETMTQTLWNAACKGREGARRLRALVARFWREPYTPPKLARWGTELHDRFLLPHFIEQDFADVIVELNAAGYPLRAEWFAQPWCDILPGNPAGIRALLAPLQRGTLDCGRVSAQRYTVRWTDVGTPERPEQLNRSG